jgi:transposase
VFIKRTTKRLKGKTYFNHLLVESVATDKGPRHRVVCSLGSLEPAPPKEWRALARRMEEALDEQQALLIDKPLAALPEPGREGLRARRPRVGADSGEFDLEGLEFEQCREAGPVHVGHQMWERLGLDQILSQAGLSDDAQLLSQLMTLNRLIAPRSELAMSEWIRRTALADMVQKDFSALNEDRLYRNLDKLYPRRTAIEAQLVERERTLFGLKETIYLYDLTSTYFEGQALANPKAMRGYSRDKRPDCKQVVVGLVLDSEGFPKAHEVFAGNRPDSTTVAEMLRALEKRTGKVPGATVVVDRGMADSENLAAIRSAGYHYLVAGQQVGRGLYQEQFEAEENWQEIEREPSPRNPSQKKVRVFVKAAQAGEGQQEVIALCWSEGRTQKDRAIRQKQQGRLELELQKLQRRVKKGRLRDSAKIHQAIGRLKERYSRVARYYQISYVAQEAALLWQEDLSAKARAQELDGTYLLKSSRLDLGHEEMWRTYILLTRVESAFRGMKSPLMERPIFHHLERRVETHIFLCVLAYHLLVCIERAFLDAGIHTSWATLREQLSTHQVLTVRLPSPQRKASLTIRRDSKPEQVHRKIYKVLRMPERIIKPIQKWEADSH